MRQCPVCCALAEDRFEDCARCGVPLNPPNPLLGKTIDAKYRIESVLGSGGQGAVYRATQVHLGREVALKVLRVDSVGKPDHVKRFQREGQTLAQISHPNIVTVFDFGISPEVGFYLVMELLKGASLRAELRRIKAFHPAVAVRLIHELCLGVQSMHSRRITHRDLKPENIFLEQRPQGGVRVKLLDFGLAKLQEAMGDDDDSTDVQQATEITTTGAILGSPAYLSPEQCVGDFIDGRSDVYTLGVVLFETLTGQLPFPSRNVAEVLRRHIAETPVAPSTITREIPPGLDSIVLRCMAKDRDDRFQTVEDLRRALDRVVLVESGVDLLATLQISALDQHTTSIDELVGNLDLEVHRTAPGRDERIGIAEDEASPISPNNLPQPLTAFIGRKQHIEAVKELLAEQRLVTIAGPGGSGKTRLALKVAEELLPQFRAGVYFVELASISASSIVHQAIAEACGISERGTRPLKDAIREFVHSRPVLLILDNCEHLIDTCAELAVTLLRHCPKLRILATSQELLDVVGEASWRLSSLTLPEIDRSHSPHDIEGSEAVQLFVDRARLSNPKFELTDGNTPAVVRIVRQLDGIPLAVELAAARVRALAPEQIAERLEDRFKLLTGGGRTVDLRQRTLRGAMDWSYDLLAPNEMTLFRRLACFAGGFTIEAAESVCSGVPPGADVDNDLDEFEILELLTDLVRKSLVSVGERGDNVRYEMLETIRRYGVERLAESGETEWIRGRHFDRFFVFAKEADSDLLSTRQDDWISRLDAEQGNLRSALEYCQSTHDVGRLLEFVGTLARFWSLRGYLREGRAWLEHTIEKGEDIRTEAMAMALRGAGRIIGFLGDYDRATQCQEQALEIWRALGDEHGVTEALNDLGILAQWNGDQEHAEQLHNSALDKAHWHGNRRAAAVALKNLGVIARNHGRYDDADRMFRESLDLFRLVKDSREIASTVNNLSVTAAARGNLEEALELGEENLVLCRKVGDRRGISIALINLGETALRLGHTQRASELLKEGVALCDEIGERRLLAYAAESVVGLASLQGRHDEALRLAGATSVLREDIGAPLATSELDELNHLLQTARELLGEPLAGKAYEGGRSMSSERILVLALEVLN